ncbi:uncharacterized protein SPAPADRAFT_59107 [Spathaspora passalidarum NRRL Y-27907]|uniref:Uncharacterized protein n=1 Tax=Spathaspora passalidarum (strain NRRL Y-27907 / 11-Y1) TaxID=619300 RepID=G3AIN0_SPAPN|nr:uncharacterized protein SPAPADRAFT_59107 [Spathaspora passalidarum NRRL Y-27907]EGW33745.1 hypothetical protein SPAPADRAFT_59107 [Spathaspora passalidarum NRRL Y-27907]
MSATENNIAATVEQDNTTQGLKTVDHFKKYPIVHSTGALVRSIPLSKTFFGVFNYSFQTVRNVQPCKAIINTSDEYANRALDEMDRWFPSLQTIETKDITTPITKPVATAIEGVQTSITTINETVSKNVVEPTINVLESAKQGFESKVYDSEGKGIISSQADPLVAPINNSLQNFVDRQFPDKERVPQEGHSSELARTLKIVSNALSRGEKTKKQ